MEWKLIYPNYSPSGRNLPPVMEAKKKFLCHVFHEIAVREKDKDASIAEIISFSYRTSSDRQGEFCEAIVQKNAGSVFEDKTVLVFTNLSDIAPNSKSALAILRRWLDDAGIADVYLCMVSCRNPVRLYRKKLYGMYNEKPNVSQPHPRKIPDSIVETAASLRMGEDPVSYAYIKECCKISSQALIQRMHKMDGVKWSSSPGRAITPAEYDHVHEQWEKYYTELGIPQNVYYDNISAKDIEEWHRWNT